MFPYEIFLLNESNDSTDIRQFQCVVPREHLFLILTFSILYPNCQLIQSFTGYGFALPSGNKPNGSAALVCLIGFDTDGSSPHQLSYFPLAL
jgi:hypothetical protein